MPRRELRSRGADIYKFLIKNKSWSFFLKKHTSLNLYKKCSLFSCFCSAAIAWRQPGGREKSKREENVFLKFSNKWKGKSGIYKLTFFTL